jgi:hypothetical protein
MNQTWSMAKKSLKSYIIDQQKNKGNIECDEDITLFLMGEEIA